METRCSVKYKSIRDFTLISKRFLTLKLKADKLCDFAFYKVKENEKKDSEESSEAAGAD